MAHRREQISGRQKLAGNSIIPLKPWKQEAYPQGLLPLKQSYYSSPEAEEGFVTGKAP